MPPQEWDALVIGASGFDVKAYPSQMPLTDTVPTPGRIRLSVGGVARNVAENLARLEVRTALFSAVSADAFGQLVLDVTAKAGVDVSQVLTSAEFRTGAFLSLVVDRYEPKWSIDDMGIAYLLSPAYINDRRAWFRNSRIVVVDANLPPLSLQAVVDLCRRHDVPLCADPASSLLAPRLKPHLRDITVLVPNAAEAEALCDSVIRDADDALDAARMLVSQGPRMVVVTLGEQGLAYATFEQNGRVPALDVDVVDTTGVGDALTAAVVFGLLNDFPADEAVRLGVSASALTLGSSQTVYPDLSLERLYDHLVL